MWRQVAQVQQSHPLHDFTLDHEFASPIIIVEAFANSDFFEHYRVGYIRPIYNQSGISQAVSPARRLKLQKQFLSFLELPYNYKVELTFSVWLPALTLTFYEPSAGDILSLTEIQGGIVEQRANLAYLQQQLDRIEQQLNTTTGQ